MTTFAPPARDRLASLPSILGAGAAVLLGAAVVLLPVPTLVQLVVALAVAVGVAFGIRWTLPGVPLWIRALYFVVFCQALLNYGFGNVMLKAGPIPLPATEMVLMLGLLAVARHAIGGPEAMRIPRILSLVCGWAVIHVTVHLPGGWARAGVLAARDALPAVEMLSLLPFYVAMRWLLVQPSSERVLARLFFVAMTVISLYVLTYPLQETLWQISPKIHGFSNAVPLLGYYAHSISCVMLFFCLLWTWQHRAPFTATKVAFVALCIVSSLLTYALTQARISYLFLMFGMVVLAATGRLWRQLALMAGIVVLGFGALVVIEVTGIEIQGRIATVTASGIWDHLLSLTGQSRSAEFEGSAAGVTQRREWRDASLEKWAISPQTMLLGIGFGDALTNHITIGTGGEVIIVREPHNSFITMLTRGGVVALVVFVTLLTYILAITATGYWRYRVHDRRLAAIFLGGFLWQVMAMLQAWGQPYFENPYTVVPNYFVYGSLIALWHHLGGWKGARPPADRAPRMLAGAGAARRA
jgi:hypothetical protein